MIIPSTGHIHLTHIQTCYSVEQCRNHNQLTKSSKPDLQSLQIISSVSNGLCLYHPISVRLSKGNVPDIKMKIYSALCNKLK